MRRVLLTLVMVLCLPTLAWANHDGQEEFCHRATVIFCENFEGRATGLGDMQRATYKNDGWNMSIGGPGVTTNAAAVFSGSKGYEMGYPAGYNVGPGFAQGRFVANTASEVFIREYYKVSPNFVWSQAGNKRTTLVGGSAAIHLLQQASSGAPWATTEQDGYPRALASRVTHSIKPDGTLDNVFVDPNVVLSSWFQRGQWYCVETRVKMNTAPSTFNGILQMWINGTLVLSRSDLVINRGGNQPGDNPPHWETLWMDGYANCWASTQSDPQNPGNCVPGDPIPAPEPALSGFPLNKPSGSWHRAQSRYYDNWVVATERVGCLGEAPPPITDTTPPSQVLNLVATADPAGAARINLTWDAATDADTGVSQYLVRRCTGASCTTHAQIGTTQALTFTDNTVQSGTTYSYRVQAQDGVGLVGALSDADEATTGTIFRSVLATDDFNRANGALGANWTTGFTGRNAPVIVSNKTQMPSVGTDVLAAYTGTATPDDQYVIVSFTPLTNIGTVSLDDLRAPGCTTRMANSPTVSHYGFRAFGWGTTPKSRIERWDAGVFTSLVTENTTNWQATDKMRCESEGTTHRLFRIDSAGNETLVLSTTDATYASGEAGMTNFIGTNGTVNDAQIDDFVMGGFSAVVVVPPAVQTLATDATGLDETHTGTASAFRVEYDCLEQQPGIECKVDVIEPIALFPSGRYTKQWQPGTTFVCLTPVDTQGVQNPAGKVCTGVTPADVTAPTLSMAFPSAALADGTTSALYGVTTNEIATCRASLTTGVDYDDMTITLTGNPSQLQHAATATGLTDGSTTHRFVKCEDPSGNESAETDITITVNSPPSDTTPPATITDFTCAPASQTSVSCTWTAPSGTPTGYQIWGFDTNLIDEQNPTPTPSLLLTVNDGATVTATVGSLLPAHSYNMKIRAFDASLNMATFSSEILVSTVSPPGPPQATAPSRRFSPALNLLRSEIENDVALVMP